MVIFQNQSDLMIDNKTIAKIILFFGLERNLSGSFQIQL